MKSHFTARAVLATLFMPIILVGCTGKEGRIQSHLKRGAEYFAQSDPDKALVEIRNVLQMDPKRAEAFYLAGQVEESRGEVRAAYADYAKAIEVRPDYFDALAGQARLNLTVGNDNQAQTIVDGVMSKDPGNTQALAIKAALLARHGDVDGAIKLAGQSANGQSMPASTATVLAGLYASKNQYADAQPIIEQALAAAPKDVTLLAIAADISRHLNEQPKTEDYFRRATLAAPKNFKVWQAWAGYEDQAGRKAEAEQVLSDSIKAVPDDSSRRLALVSMTTRHQGEQAGVALLTSMSKDRPKDYPLSFELVNYYRSKGRIEDARRILESIAHADSKSPSGLSARNQLAALDLASGNLAEARHAADEILKTDPRDSSALMLRGRLELADKQVDSSIADFRAAARDKPDSVQVLGLLAKAYQVKKEPDLARDTLSDAAKLFPNRPEITLLWMQYLDAEGRDTDAIAAADAAIRRNPQNLDLVRVKAGLEEKIKATADAEATLRSGIAAHPTDPLPEMWLGQMLVREKKYDQAIAAYDQAAQLSASAEPRAAALGVLTSQKRFSEAEKRVDTAIQKAPDSAVNYQLRGDVLVAEGNAAAAEAPYRKAIELEPTSVSAYLNLTNYLALQKRNDDVKAAFKTGLEKNPNSALLQTAYADFLTKTGQFDDAIGIYNHMLADNSGNAVAANNLAYILTEAKGDKASLQRALLLTKGFEFATDPGFLDTLGWTYYKLGQFGDAVPIYQRATLLAPNSPLLELHYGMALYKNGDVPQGQEHLKLAVQRGGKLPDDAQQMVGQG